MCIRDRNKIEEPEPLSRSGIVGISWAASGGEATALLRDKYLAADGIENVKKVLEELEDDKLPECEFVELNACVSGCVGGALTFETPFIAKTRLQILRRCLPVSRNAYNAEEAVSYTHLDVYKRQAHNADHVNQTFTAGYWGSGETQEYYMFNNYTPA